MPDSSKENHHYCHVPYTPERVFGPDVSDGRARIIRIASKKWVNDHTLHYYFLEGSSHLTAEDSQKDVVRQAFGLWMDVGIGIKFKEVFSSADAEFKIGFDQNDGSWSYVGRDALNKEHTMNFGWDLTRSGEIDTAIHEIGHALGFTHEHQNPNAGIVWNEDAVYADLAEYPNYWPRDVTFRNILRKIASDAVDGTDWDPNSIMHYPFKSGLIREPEKYRNGLSPASGLSEKDISQVKLFYPKTESAFQELKPFDSQRLSIEPGQQKNFAVNPSSSRDYSFRTFGNSDTVMVLFEKDGDDLHYVIGDDDSGTNLNANFTVRLIKDRKYVLKIRLYYSFSSGDTAVMMW